MIDPSHEMVPDETNDFEKYCRNCWCTPSRDPETLERPCVMVINPNRKKDEEEPKMFDKKFGNCWHCSEGFCRDKKKPQADCVCCGTHPTALDGVIQGIVRSNSRK